MEHVQPTVMLLGENVSVPGKNLETLALPSQLKNAATHLVSIQVMLFVNVEIS